jgi:hypothetical protein
MVCDMAGGAWRGGRTGAVRRRAVGTREPVVSGDGPRVG